MSTAECLQLTIDMINNENLVAIDDDGRQQHDSSFSSDDTEFLGLPSSQAVLTPLTSQLHSSVRDAAATQSNAQLALFSCTIASFDSNNESDSNENNEDNVSSSTTPTPPILSCETTPIACNKFNYRCGRHFSPEWSSSDENTSFFGDKHSILSSACDADRQLATSEYFKSSCGAYYYTLYPIVFFPSSFPKHL